MKSVKNEKVYSCVCFDYVAVTVIAIRFMFTSANVK